MDVQLSPLAHRPSSTGGPGGPEALVGLLFPSFFFKKKEEQEKQASINHHRDKKHIVFVGFCLLTVIKMTDDMIHNRQFPW